MNLEILRKKNWIVYECISGSHAYGTNIEGSDTDIRGIYIQPTDEILAGRYVPQISDSTNDITFYEIGNFIELACKGNPNIIELLNVAKENIIYKHPKLDLYLDEDFKEKVITTKLKHSFTGYAYAQIKKAKGLNKKINWDSSAMVRKGVLDFCYVLTEKEETIKFKKWSETNYSQEEIGLAKVNNIAELYSMYYIPEYGGLVKENSNEVQIKSIPKDAPHLGYIRFAKDSYSTHCKDYREYSEWLEKRNPQRYRDNLKGEQGYDHKNMMHCMRLLNMAKDIAEGKGIVVKRPEYNYLLKIRNGEIPYQKLLEKAEKLVDQIKLIFDSGNLPREVKIKYQQDLILKIRKNEI